LISAKTISAEAAQAMIEAAVEAARTEGLPASIAVVDNGGALKAFLRMDGATLLTVGASQDKAYSAVLAGRPTDAWQAIFDKEPALARGIPPIDRMMVFGGGFPVTVDGEIVGGIG